MSVEELENGYHTHKDQAGNSTKENCDLFIDYIAEFRWTEHSALCSI